MCAGDACQSGIQTKKQQLHAVHEHNQICLHRSGREVVHSQAQRRPEGQDDGKDAEPDGQQRHL